MKKIIPKRPMKESDCRLLFTGTSKAYRRGTMLKEQVRQNAAPAANQSPLVGRKSALPFGVAK